MDRTKQAAARQGFTLIELLVVIAIIGLLAAIIVPALNGALGTAKKARAMQMCKDIQGACQRYFSEYNRMPVPKGTKHGQNDAKYGKDNSAVIDILILSDDLKAEDLPVVNPRSIRFLDMDAKTLEAYNEDKTKGLLDPWYKKDDNSTREHHYEIYLDMTFDDVIEADNADEIKAKVAVRSAGPDGKWDTKDDIRTW
jgi:prepilin-type N-terminal cleavage/methylation domain-containing protein